MISEPFYLHSRKYFNVLVELFLPYMFTNSLYKQTNMLPHLVNLLICQIRHI